MPIRQYQCRDCGKETENLERNDEEKLLSCPQCGSDNLERVITTYGGYDFASGPSSVRPKNAGSFRGKK